LLYNTFTDLAFVVYFVQGTYVKFNYLCTDLKICIHDCICYFGPSFKLSLGSKVYAMVCSQLQLSNVVVMSRSDTVMVHYVVLVTATFSH